MEKFFNREVRKYFYGVLAALAPVAVGFGLVDTHQAGLLLGLGAALLAVSGSAIANLPPKEPKASTRNVPEPRWETVSETDDPYVPEHGVK